MVIKGEARRLTPVAAWIAGPGFAVPAVVASGKLLLLLGAPALLPLWIVCSRDCGNFFSCQPIPKSSQDPACALILLAAWCCAGRGVLQPWKEKGGSRNRNLGSVAGQESLRFVEHSQWSVYMNAMLKKYLSACCPVLCCWTGVLCNYPEQQSLPPCNHRVIRWRVCKLKCCNSLVKWRESRKRLKMMPTCYRYSAAEDLAQFSGWISE